MNDIMLSDSRTALGISAGSQNGCRRDPEQARRTGITLLLVFVAALCGMGCANAQTPATTTTLTLSAAGSTVSSAAAGAVVTLSANVVSAGVAASPGQVAFCDANAPHCTDNHLLGISQVTAAGTAVLRLRPAPGLHQWSAHFLGTNRLSASTSPTAGFTVSPPAATISASSTSLATTGQWGNYVSTATVTEVGSTVPPSGSVMFADTSQANAVLASAPLGGAVAGLSWMSAHTVTTTTSSQSIATGDFNGDGIPDFVTIADGTSRPILVFLGHGDGTYTAAPQPAFTGYSLEPVLVVDANGDGRQDLAILDTSGAVDILLGQGDGTFQVLPPVALAQTQYTDMTTGDFNGDGLPDLAVIGPGTPLTVLLGKGDGSFAIHVSPVTLGHYPQAVAAADLNGDGRPDLVIADAGDDQIWTLLGQPDGSFTMRQSFHCGIQQAAIALGDLNGDGFADLVIGYAQQSGGQRTATILAGNGDGSFTPPAVSQVLQSSYGKVAVADFNADGLADIVVVDGFNNVFTAFINSAAGTLTPYTSMNPGTTQYSVAAAVADIDGDGRADVLLGFPADLVRVYLTQPTETVTATAPLAPAATGPHLVKANYAGDSNYAASSSAAMSLWGQLPATTTQISLSGATAGGTVPPGTLISLNAHVSTSSGPVPGIVQFCDDPACLKNHLLGTSILDANGNASLHLQVAAGTHSFLAQFMQNGFGLRSTSAPVALTAGPARPPVLSDTLTFTNTGQSGAYGLTGVLTGFGSSVAPTGSMSFVDTSFSNTILANLPLGPDTPGRGWQMSTTPALANGMIQQVAGDFNGDGITDIAVLSQVQRYSTASISVYLGVGDGTFYLGPTTNTNVLAFSLPFSFACGDLNGDNKLDLVLLYYDTDASTSKVVTLINKGDGSFTQSATSVIFAQADMGGEAISGYVSVADFDGDGKLDIAVAGDYVNFGGVTVALGNGDGTFRPLSPNVVPEQGTDLIAVGDLNGDGIPDLAVPGSSTAGITILLGNGDGTFPVTSDKVPVSGGLTSLLFADVNDDGKLDMVIGTANGVVVSLGHGDGTFAAQEPLAPGRAGSLVAGDFDGDGLLDLAGETDGLLTLFLGRGDGTFNPVNTQTPLPLPEFSGSPLLVTGDFDADGTADLALGYFGSTSLTLLRAVPTHSFTATISPIAPIGPGDHVVTASYAGDTLYPATISSPETLPAGLAPLVVTPAPGLYTGPITITLSESVPGASIFYNVTGGNPTHGSILYTGPIHLTQGGFDSLFAYAQETGYDSPLPVYNNYSILLPPTQPPVISLSSGSYAAPQTVTLTDAAPNATIYYTLDGTLPDTTSPVYSAPLSISSNAVLAAVAIAPGESLSTPVKTQYFFTGTQSSFIYSVAGVGAQGNAGDGGPATLAYLNNPQAVQVDAAGNLYIVDTDNNVVRKVAAGTHIITTIAGNGTNGFSGDGGPATQAQLSYPSALTLSPTGDLYIADSNNHRIRMVSALTGTIQTVVGNGISGLLGDGGPATAAALGYPRQITCSSAGDLYITDSNRIRKVTAATGVINTIVGGGVATQPLAPPLQVFLQYVTGVAVDSQNNVYLADQDSGLIYKLSSVTNTLSIIGGTHTAGAIPPALENVPATSVALQGPDTLALDGNGNLFVSELNVNVIRKISLSTGLISTVAGVRADYDDDAESDGAPATLAALDDPEGIAIDAQGNLFIADTFHQRIRAVYPQAATPTTQAHAPTFSVAAGTFNSPQTVTVLDDTPGASIYISLDGTPANTSSPGYRGPISITGTDTISAIAVAPGTLPSNVATATYTITSLPAATLTTIAGTGFLGVPQDGAPAKSSSLALPIGVALDAAGNLYYVDYLSETVWRVEAATGTFTRVAGTGQNGYTGDGGPATQATMRNPSYVAVAANGDVYISDSGNTVIRKVAAATGIISTITAPWPASGIPPVGDGGPASSASLQEPSGLALDKNGNLFVADEARCLVRRIDAVTEIITTVAGGTTVTGYPGLSQCGPGQDGIAATASLLYSPGSLALDAAGNLYITSQGDGRVRRVDVNTGFISTVAGGGNVFFPPDGTPAVAAALRAQGIALDAAGNIFLSESAHAIYRVSAADGTLTRVAGNTYFGDFGDGISATIAELKYPSGLVLTPGGDIDFADQGASRLRKVVFNVPAPSPVLSLAAGTYYTSQSVSITATAGASIFYTTDGTAPSTNSTRYTGPLTITASETVEAIAVGSSGLPSPPVSATYTLAAAAQPSLTWPTPPAIIYGMPLGPAQLNAAASVPGTFAYSPAAGTVLPVGTQTLTATFTPTDAVRYTTATTTTTLAVTAAQPLLTWPATAAITYGTALSAAQLNATASVAGTFTYTPALGTVLPAGLQTLTATFTPTDATQYTTASATMTLTITAAQPVIVWPVAAAIPYGTPLGSAQLNATSSTAGTFTYTPAAGTVLPVGPQILKAVFTPASQPNYNSATAASSITVRAAAPALGALTSSQNPVLRGSSVTFSGSLIGTGPVAPTGTVILTDNGTTLGTASLNSNGLFTYTTASLVDGSHAITASYSGDSSYTAASSTSLVQLVADYSIAPAAGTPASVSASPGGQASFSLNVQSPSLGLPLTLSVTGLPAGASASFSPSSIAAGAGSTTVTLLIAVPNSASLHPPHTPWERRGVPVLFATAMLPLFLRHRRNRRGLLVFALAALVLSAGISGCAGGSAPGQTTSNPTPQARTYPLVVSATAGTITQTTALTLIVK